MEKLHLTFGSPSVLTNITTRNTDKPFFYFVDNNNHQQYALITIDLNSTFFKSNLNFKILNGQLNNNIDSLWFFNYFSLDIREQETYLSKLKIIPTDSLSFLCCQSFDSDFKFLIISNWSNEKNYKTWQNANNFVLTKIDSFNSLYSQKKNLSH
ncbi:hypothetical protein [Liquorilactobacillus cacaonum]|uniref:hypothetical protein n=1 Tax=Liquorilactobacillus cacaonum TaxID=483012 RepID=UPI00070A88D8|nr:hypothetical protein [Liquorilactobacillus cacaonum]